MDPITIITAISAASSLIKALAPTVRDMAARGEITAEQQAEVLKAFEALRDEDFSGPEWQVES